MYSVSSFKNAFILNCSGLDDRALFFKFSNSAATLFGSMPHSAIAPSDISLSNRSAALTPRSMSPETAFFPTDPRGTKFCWLNSPAFFGNICFNSAKYAFRVGAICSLLMPAVLPANTLPPSFN